MRAEAGADLLFIWDECAWKLHNGTGKGNWGEYQTHTPPSRSGLPFSAPLVFNGLNPIELSTIPDECTALSWFRAERPVALQAVANGREPSHSMAASPSASSGSTGSRFRVQRNSTRFVIEHASDTVTAPHEGVAPKGEGRAFFFGLPDRIRRIRDGLRECRLLSDVDPRFAWRHEQSL